MALVLRSGCAVAGLLRSRYQPNMACSRAERPSSDMAAFRDLVAKSKHIVVLTGAGISAESGVPTFRGPGGYWRRFQATDLATPVAFAKSPSLVWEFYHYRREVVLGCQSNAAHRALAECEARLQREHRRLVVITQNVDELHRRAGTRDLVELHGSLFKTRCTQCGHVEANFDSPICAALAGRGSPEDSVVSPPIPVSQLPRQSTCGGLLRPDIIWFGEQLDASVVERAHTELSHCDLCLVVGTSSIVYPAAGYAEFVAERGVPVAEFNVETTPSTSYVQFHFRGPAGATVPEALGAGVP